MSCLIVCQDSNGGIGYRGKMPWHIMEELRLFKQITWGKDLIMGRVTAEGLGKPLVGRNNYVIAHEGWSLAGFERISKEQAIELSLKDSTIFIGGSKVYEFCRGLIDVMYISTLKKKYLCDTFFQRFSPIEWKKTETTDYVIFTHNVYIRRR